MGTQAERSSSASSCHSRQFVMHCEHQHAASEAVRAQQGRVDARAALVLAVLAAWFSSLPAMACKHLIHRAHTTHQSHGKQALAAAKRLMFQKHDTHSIFLHNAARTSQPVVIGGVQHGSARCVQRVGRCGQIHTDDLPRIIKLGVKEPLVLIKALALTRLQCDLCGTGQRNIS